MILKQNFTFIDLFAGIGGFNCAMSSVSNGKAKCLFASEIDENARKVYKDNFNIDALGDIKNINPDDYPIPDVVCGGFPCQTFSKAGKQDGFKDPRGTLFNEILRIIKSYDYKKRPKIIFLENVPNLIHHDNGETWKTIKYGIKNLGYNVVEEPILMEPVNLGIPQLRNRALILAVRNDICSKPIELKICKQKRNSTSIFSVLNNVDDPDLIGARKITPHQKYVIDAWNDFVKTTKLQIVGFPIWSAEFGKTSSITKFPKWKQDFIIKNRNFYINNKKTIDDWLAKWKVRKEFNNTEQKFEWQVNNKIHDIYDGIIQFRPSGIRVKRATESPALVAMVQLPIIGKLKRTISVKEAAKLQSFPDDFIFNESPALAFKQLGNAVNVKVIQFVFEKFVKFIDFNKEAE